MHIELDDSTKQWLIAKGKPVSVKTISVSNCCAPPIQDLMTTFGTPKDLHNYKEIKIDNISIYIEKPLSFNERLTFKLSGIGLFKMVSAKVG